jgi:hypothetical protein
MPMQTKGLFFGWSPGLSILNINIMIYYHCHVLAVNRLLRPFCCIFYIYEVDCVCNPVLFPWKRRQSAPQGKSANFEELMLD